MQKRLFLLALALIILIPATGVFTGLGAMSEQEMAHFEGRRKKTIKQSFSRWYTDNLGGRKLFLTSYASMLLYVFGQSSNPDTVQIGQNDFLFLGDAHARTFSYHSGIPRPAKERLHLGEGFKTIITLFAKKGIPVLVTIAPDKATLYSEYYPKWVKHVGPSFSRKNFNASPLLREHVLFLEDTLREYKARTDALFWKNDSHWNPMGAYLGYTALMDGLERLTGKALHRVPLLGWKTLGPNRGDLERMNRVAKATDVLHSLLIPSAQYTHVPHEQKGDFFKYSNLNALNPLNIAIVRDSFYNLIPTIYRQTFTSTYEIHFDRLTKANLKALLAEAPNIDLVIFLLVERTFPERDSLLKRLASELSVPRS